MHSIPASLAEMVVNGNRTGSGLFAGGMGIVLLIIWLTVFIFWLWMLIDCVSSTMPTNEKILWFLVIFFLPLIGSLIYYFVKRSGARGGAVR